MNRIAVVGAGISGMAAAWLLSRRHQVHLFEREPRLGGHTHTHTIDDRRGPLQVDTGFIVHNDRTYPNLVRLLGELGVARQPSDMSFGVSCERTGFEYSSRGPSGLFAQRRNLVAPRHYAFLKEILRFNREARKLLLDPGRAEVKLGDYLEANHYSQRFSDYYLYPMASAVWSTSLEEMRDFPAFTLLRFFENHGFLGVDTHHQWYSITGGSSQYIAPLTAPYRERITLGADLSGITREAGSATLHFNDRSPQSFDQVVMACHGNQALALLRDASPREREVLGNFSTSRNDTMLHTDTRLLPRRPAARASWNYHLSANNGSNSPEAAKVTYHMNRLQALVSDQDYCVTLNGGSAVDQEKVLRRMTYFHPLYTLDAVRAQGRWSEVSGVNRTHFCGAYWLYGFHEDGLNSAIRVAQTLGVEW